MPPPQDGSWDRIGELLVQRRIEIDPRYRNRRLFALERGVNWRTLHDLERAKRTNFEPETITAVEVAYGLVRESFGRTLAGGDLEPLPAVTVTAPAPVYPLAAREGISPEALGPYIASVRRDLADAIVRYGPEPSGAQAFRNPRECAIWGYAGMAATDKVELMAVIRLFDDLGVPVQEEGNGEGRDAVLCRTQVAHLHDCHYPVTLAR